MRLIVLQFVFIALIIILLPTMISNVRAQGSTEPDASYYNMILIAIAMVVAIPSIAAAYVLKTAVSSAIAALTERQSIGGLALIFVAMGEAIAIYGLIVGMMLMQYLPSV